MKTIKKKILNGVALDSVIREKEKEILPQKPTGVTKTKKNYPK